MRVDRVSLPVIHENPQSYSPSSQDARIEGEGAAPVMPSLDALRLEARLRTMPNVQPDLASTRSERVTSCAKSFTRRLGLVFGMAVLPSFACVLMGPIGLAVPAVLIVASAVCFWLSGKETLEQELAMQRMREVARTYDPR